MKHCYFLVILLTITISLQAIFDSHFFHAAYFWNEPRFEETLLQTYIFDISGDSTTQSRNGTGCLVPLFDLYGTHTLRLLGAQVPDLNERNDLDRLLLELAQSPARDCFGNLSFGGLFKMMRFDFKFYQNLGYGFFIGLELPVFEFTIIVDPPTDLSPRDNPMPNIHTPLWRSFLHSFDELLQLFDLGISPQMTTDLGDTVIAAGYTLNYDEHWYFDLIDATFALAGIIPTGRQTDPHKPFDIPNGYNGHFGVGCAFDGAIGLWDWATLGAHAEYLVLIENEKEIRIRTDLDQNGLIKLTTTNARVDPGNLWRFGPYFKADHVLGGFSFLLGYSYERKNRDCITSCCSPCNLDLANSDPVYAGFAQHTFHLIAEYDASSDDLSVGPRVAFFFNHSMFGRRIFDTNIKGGYLGVDVTWCF